TALGDEVVDQILGHAEVAGGLKRIHHVIDGGRIVDHDQILRVCWLSLPIICVRRGGPRPVRLAGPGRCPLKAEISGSNPLRATSTPRLTKSVVWEATVNNEGGHDMSD